MNTKKKPKKHDKLVDGIIGSIPLIIGFIINPDEILLFIIFFVFYGIYLFIKYKKKNE